MSFLSVLKRDGMPSAAAGFLDAARTAFAEIPALLARERKWRRDRAALATMDYAALRDIGFAPAPWSADAGASDRFARDIAWSSDKHLRTLLRDCGCARDAARAAANRIARTENSERLREQARG